RPRRRRRRSGVILHRPPSRAPPRGPTMRRSSSSALLLLALIAAPRWLRADSAADALVAEGVELRRTHRDEEAYERFRRALAIADSPRTHAQLGFAAQALGRWVEA